MSTLLVDRVAHRLGQPSASANYYPTRAMITNGLNEGAREVVKRLVESALPEHIKTYSASNTNGVFTPPSDLLKDIQLEKTANYVRLRKISPYMKNLLKQSHSAHYSVSADPAYYFQYGKIYCEPSASIAVSLTLTYLQEPPVCTSSTNENYASWNKDLEELAIDYSVILGVGEQIGDSKHHHTLSVSTAKNRSISALGVINSLAFSTTALDSVLLSVSSAITSMETSFATNEDFELAGEYLKKASTLISEAGSELGSENAQYSADIQKASGFINTASNELQIASDYLQSNQTKLSELQNLEAKFTERINAINMRFA